MFDRIKQLFSKNPVNGPSIQAVPRKNVSKPRHRRPSFPDVGWNPVKSSIPEEDSIQHAMQMEERTCPNCGQPMLAAWGATCGNCRPRMASPKTLFLSVTDAKAQEESTRLCLGWFAILSSPDPQFVGKLLELSTPTTVFSRGPKPSTALETWIDINDKYLSNGHAWVHRPKEENANAAFSIRDRHVPGPSANGTFVNSRKLEPGEVFELSEGDSVRIGGTEMLFKSLWLSPSGGGQK